MRTLAKKLRQGTDRLGDYFDCSSRLGPIRRVHALSTMGDAFTTVALAGSLFFSISPTAARSKITLYLLLTVAPFGVVAPILGPLLDRNRGSRRIIVSASLVVRALMLLLMVRDLKSFLLFPEAFVFLVASKTYLVAKAALVPDLVDDTHIRAAETRRRFWRRQRGQQIGNPALVVVNSGLSLLSAIVGFLGGAIAAGILKTPQLGSVWILRIGTAILILGAIQARHLRTTRQLDPSPLPLLDTNTTASQTSSSKSAAKAGPSVLLAAAAMSVLRGSVGFFTFFIAFNFRKAHEPTYYFGLVLIASAFGSALATALTPRIRRLLAEESLLIAALIFEATLGIIGAAISGHPIEILMAATIGFVASSGKLAFDALVQYNIEPNTQGRAFARFETRFQLAWVLGALIPTIVDLPLEAGDLIIAFTALVAAISFSAGRRAIRRSL